MRVKKRKEEKVYNTHKLYDGGELSLNEKQLINIDKNMSKYRDTFKLELVEDNNFSSSVVLQLGLLTDELCYYYNNDLCYSMTCFKELYKTNAFELRKCSYYAENIIFRITSLWEYIQVVLNKFLQTNLLSDHDIKEKIIEAKCMNVEFVKNGNSYKTIYKRVSESEEKCIRIKLQKKLLVNRGSNKKNDNSLFREIKKNFAKNEYIDMLIDLKYSKAVKELVELRNKMMHTKPLSATAFVDFCDIFAEEAISFNKKGWYNIDNLCELLECNVFIVRNAIHLLRYIIFNNFHPNIKSNEGKKFIVYKVKCEDCKKEFVYNDIFIEKYPTLVICPYCKSKQLHIGNKKEVFDSMYLNIMTQLSDIIFKYFDESS